MVTTSFKPGSSFRSSKVEPKTREPKESQKRAKKVKRPNLSTVAIMAEYVIPMVLGMLLAKVDQETWERFDFFNQYYSFPKDFTGAIDQLLMNPKHGLVNSKAMVSPTVWVPDLGVHYLYDDVEKRFNRCYVVMEKRSKTVNGQAVVTYRAIVRPWSQVDVKLVSDRLKQSSSDTIQTIHTDTSELQPSCLHVKKRYLNPPLSFQKQVAKHAIRRYEENKFKNVKYLITGARGLGKTTVGPVIKKLIDEQLGVDSLLFDDFNPSVVGVNVQTLVLAKASDTTPVILILDEYDLGQRGSSKQADFRFSLTPH